MNRSVLRIVLLVVIDSAIISSSVYISYLLRFDFQIRPQFIDTIPLVTLIYTGIIIMFMFVNKIYRRLWRYASIGDLVSIIRSIAFGSGSYFILQQFIINELYRQIIVPKSIYVLTSVITFIGITASRLAWRLVSDNYTKIQPHHHKALIIGAGEAGIMVAKELKQKNSTYYPVAFIDDDDKKRNFELMGIPVVGNRHDIMSAVEQYDIKDIILAIPTASRTEVAKIIEICKKTRCQIKIIPRVNDLIDGTVTINMIRDVNVEDLLGREPVELNLKNIAGYLNDKTVLITGAGGSIGSELCRQVALFGPKKLLLLGHGENSIYEIELELKRRFQALQIEAIIADIQDRKRLNEIFILHSPEVIFHAAAHKHVPMMEKNPLEAVKNNIIGTKNVVDCADKYNAKRFVMISTDKAVNPTNVMGATKRVAEMIVQCKNQHSSTVYSAVRFGNVLGSRGSVIPVFKKQIEEGGPVTVTHPEMIRYFMTIPEAVQLVIEAGALAEGGEVFILDMGKPVKIADLARDLIRLSGLEPDKDIKIQYSGIRPGEKLFEELLTNEEGISATKHNRIFISKNEIHINDDYIRNIEYRIYSFMEREDDRTSIKDEIKLFLKQIVPTYNFQSAENLTENKEALRASLEVLATIEKK